MHFYAQVICLVSLVTAIRGIVLPSTAVNDLLLDQQSPAHGLSFDVDRAGSGETVPTVQTSTGEFRDQYDARENALKREGYFVVDWDGDFQHVEWEEIDRDNPEQPIPENEMAVADHIFELQMLTRWMNERSKSDKYFNKNTKLKLKGILNGRANAAYIPWDLNCIKTSIVKQAMTDAFAKRPACKPGELADITLASYVQHEEVEKDIVQVYSAILKIIAEINLEDAKDFETVIGEVMRCLGVKGLTH